MNTETQHPRKRGRPLFSSVILLGLLVTLAGCSIVNSSDSSQPNPTPTIIPLFNQQIDPRDLLPNPEEMEPVIKATVVPVDLDAKLAQEIESETQQDAERVEQPVSIVIDAGRDQQTISPLIYGVTNAPDNYIQRLRPTINSWGGDGAARYNWEDGNAWNLGAANSYRNSPVVLIDTGVHPALAFAQANQRAEAATRFILPTIGWVAADNDPETCSFRLPDGSCGSGNASTCQSSDVIGNPLQTSIESDTEDVQAFIDFLIAEGAAPDLVSITDEPELWGVTHYDIHPTCTTFEEVLTTYITYAEAVREQLPEAELMGPGTSSWHFYTNSAAGFQDFLRHDEQPFIPWFLEQMRQHELRTGVRHLDILDIHYYPEGVYFRSDQNVSGAQRLRATRSLWDPLYVDETWIRTAVQLIPRMQFLIEEHYPGTKLSISEWNFGSDTSINGALAIADVLGIFGREGLYMASYETYPPFQSPGYFAFKLYTNYDNAGGEFGDISVFAESSDHEVVSAFAALDSETDNLHIMLINKIDQGFGAGKTVSIDLQNYDPDQNYNYFYYVDPGNELADPGIQVRTAEITDNQFEFSLPSESIVHIVLIPENDSP